MAGVVSNTSPIRALVHLNLAHLFQLRFGSIIIPPAVVQELERPVGSFPPIKVTKLAFVQIVAPSNHTQVDQLKEELDPGESEAITLSMELGAELFLVDDRKARTLLSGWVCHTSAHSVFYCARRGGGTFRSYGR